MQQSNRLPIVGVMGSGTESHTILANQVGRLLAGMGVHLLTGGGEGVMSAVSKAFFETSNRKGMVIGIVPCRDGDPGCHPKPGYPNPWVEIAIATHLPLSGTQGTEPMSRNHINVLTSDAVVALPGGAGTASEMSLVMRYRKPVIAFVGADSRIPNLNPSIPIAEEIGEIEKFLRQHLSTPA